MKKQEDIKFTENRVKLNPNTAFFKVMEREKAEQYVYYNNTYIGRCYNQNGDLIGWYCPA